VVTDDFDPGGSDSPIERNISDLKTCVIKEKISYLEAIAAAQSHKVRLFTDGLRKPRFKDINYAGWMKVFDAFWYMDGSYDCDFLRCHKYNVNVPPEVISMKVGGNVYDTWSDGNGEDMVSMDVVEKCNNQNLLTMCLNATTGLEEHEQVPLMSEEKIHVDSIEDYVSSGMEGSQDIMINPVQVFNDEALSQFEGALLTRPRSAERILQEQTGIEQSLTYVARFVISFINQKDGIERKISVHSVTGENTW